MSTDALDHQRPIAKQIPKLLSAARLALVPVMVAFALAGSHFWFLALLAAALLTDAVDGWYARTFDAASDLGRRLDSWADYALTLAAAGGIVVLWPHVISREIWWFLAGIAGYFSVIVYGLVRFGAPPSYHTWAAKAGAIAIPLTLIPLLSGWTPWPFRVAMAFEVLVGIEGLLIAWTLPRHRGEMASLWHARRVRAAAAPDRSSAA